MFSSPYGGKTRTLQEKFKFSVLINKNNSKISIIKISVFKIKYYFDKIAK
tara:strand:- start:10905 stop:11054 length:150 start_codon:yes stop_codon:yes gene_type:complete